MRSPRIKEPGAGYYHVISRVVDRQRVFDRDEKHRFVKLMRVTEAFTGCQVLAYALLDNHFHILLYVPDREPVSDAEFLRRLGALYREPETKAIAASLAALRVDGQQPAAEALREKYLRRMADLSEFVKTLKQRFTQSYNRRHGRKGTLWEERFKSVLIGGSAHALAAVAAYVDLNAVRAGLVADPKDYPFCSYGEAVAGSALARACLCAVLGSPGVDADWRQVAAEYRELLYVTGAASGVAPGGRPLRRGFAPEQVGAVIGTDGALSLSQLLHCRVRYFTDGVILGSRAFVEDAFARHRPCFSVQRTSGARSMTGGSWGDLWTVRRLRLQVIIPAGGA